MDKSTLEAGEALAAAGATAPRVTLDKMKSRVAREYYFTAGDALSKTPGIVHWGPLDILTICILVLDNGWTLLGKSAPASADNFDAEKGRRFAYDDALKQLWPLEGYLLREELHTAEAHAKVVKGMRHSGAAPKVLVQPHDGMEQFAGSKIINAKPMSRAVYVQFRGWDLPADENGNDAGYLVEYTDKIQEPPTMPGFKGYVSWSPADVFEAAYHKTTARQDPVEREMGETFEIGDEPEEPLGFE